MLYDEKQINDFIAHFAVADDVENNGYAYKLRTCSTNNLSTAMGVEQWCLFNAALNKHVRPVYVQTRV